MKKMILNPSDVSKIMDISINTAYRIVRELNKEMEEINEKREKRGERPYVLFNKKIYAKYFSERYYGEKFLKIKEIEERFNLKEWEAKEISFNIKKELIENGFKFIKGRIPEKYLMEKMM